MNPLSPLRFCYQIYAGGNLHRRLYNASYRQHLSEIWKLHRLNQLEPWEYFQFHLSDPKLNWEEKRKFMSYNQACLFHRVINPMEQRGVILNKLTAFCYLKSFDIPTPEVYGLFDPQTGFTLKNEPLRTEDDFARLLNDFGIEEFVIKPVSTEKGEGISVFIGKDGERYVSATGEKYSVRELFDYCLKQHASMESRSPRGLLLQERIRQHDDLQRINPRCLNSCRVITLINDEEKIEVLVTEMKFGVGNAMVDNIDKGGFAAMIDATGSMLPAAILSPEKIQYLEYHPTTGERFAGLKVPYFQETVDLAIRAQALLPQLRSLAWDIAITNSGPTILEGNAWWGYTVQGDLRKGLLRPSVRKILQRSMTT